MEPTRGVTALMQLADDRIASGSRDKTIRLWDLTSGAETARLEVDASISALAALSDGRLVAGDNLVLHWLEIVEVASIHPTISSQWRRPSVPSRTPQLPPRSTA